MKAEEDNRAFVQGSKEWLDLRKTKITATDASIIMKASKWKTPLQLYNEKTSPDGATYLSEAMRRGIELEPIARDLFTFKTGIKLIDKDDPRNVVINPDKPWMMASFDGISECGKYSVEIKCPMPNSYDHYLARNREIPPMYYPQVQHQIECLKPQAHFFMVFDGFDGDPFDVAKNPSYIENMIEEELKFYILLHNKTPPEPGDGDYIDRTDHAWLHRATQINEKLQTIKMMESQVEFLKGELIELSGGLNCKGGGVSLSQVQRKGHVDYAKIPQLQGMDLESYRKPSSTSWRINVT